MTKKELLQMEINSDGDHCLRAETIPVILCPVCHCVLAFTDDYDAFCNNNACIDKGIIYHVVKPIVQLERKSS